MLPVAVDLSESGFNSVVVPYIFLRDTDPQMVILIYGSGSWRPITVIMYLDPTFLWAFEKAMLSKTVRSTVYH